MSGVVVGTTAALATGYSIYQGENPAKNNARPTAKPAAANRKMLAEAEKQTEREAQQANRINKRYAESRRCTGSYGATRPLRAAGTMPTGPQGVDLSALQLGRNTLLGQ